MYSPALTEDFEQDLVRNLIQSSSLTVPVDPFVKQEAERAVASDAKFRQENIRKLTFKEEVTPPSMLTGRSPESLKTSKNDK